MRDPLLKLVVALAVASLAIPAGAQMKVQKPGNSPLKVQNASQIPVASAKRVSIDEAQKLVAAGKAVFIDVRSTISYATLHIKGAISVPQSKLGEELPRLPTDKMLIPYCACVEEHSAALAVLFFNAHKIENTAALRGGWKEWNARHLPVESSAR